MKNLIFFRILPILFVLFLIEGVLRGEDLRFSAPLKMDQITTTLDFENRFVANQTDSTSTDTLKKTSFVLIPIVYFTPETDWAFGGATIMSIRLGDEQTRASEFQAGIAYTLNKQWLLYSRFNLFTDQELYKIYGEAGYYRYSYFFYGIGNDIHPDLEPDEELYSVNFPRFRLNASRQIAPNFYLGLRYWFEDYNMQEVEEGRLLAQGENAITGSTGGIVSGLGFIANIDKRDNIFSAHQGYQTEAVLFRNASWLGSDFNFTKLYLNSTYYLPLSKKQTLAFQAYGEFTWGDPPFHMQSLMGGRNRMRGYIEGTYRDLQYVTTAVEYRFPIYWRFYGATFGSLGAVGADLNDLEWRYTFGGGLRFLVKEKERIFIRVDLGFGKNTSGFYLVFNEAF